MSMVLGFIENVLTPIVGKLLIGKNKYCNVIYYHDIVSGPGDSFDKTNIDTFKRHMDYILNNGYETVLFQDLNDSERLSFKKKRVIISFDDGWESNYMEIFDYMYQKGIKYNVFLAVGKIGVDPDYLTWEMINTMSKSGVVDFGVHTFSHVDMSDIQIVDIDKEITEANEVYYHHLNKRPEDFCYPFGYYSQNSNMFLEKHSDYKRIYTSQKMYSYQENGAIIFGRNGISEDHSMKVFERKLKGLYNSYMILDSLLVRPMIMIKNRLRKKKK